MTASDNSQKKERPSTYIVQDRKSQEELSRLKVQDQMITAAMGGVLPEQTDTSSFHHVLDVGSGSGSWVIEAAKTYSTMTRVVGVDISQRMIKYACTQAESQGLQDRVEFHVMDVLRMLEFADSSFDLVNLRFGGSFLRSWDWPKLLSELLRVTRPGGMVRLTETEAIQKSNSSALRQFHEMLLCASYKAGHSFERDNAGLTAHLAELLVQHGFQKIQEKIYALEYRAGTAGGQSYYLNAQHGFQTLRPFLQKWGCASENYEAICQTALNDIQQSDFCVTWNVLTACGKKPK
jgi:ubiquinone/menaquinone biosynthesis C-methylase UbiE